MLEGRTGTIEGPAYDPGNGEYVLFRMDGETAAAIVDMKDLTVLGRTEYRRAHGTRHKEVGG